MSAEESIFSLDQIIEMAQNCLENSQITSPLKKKSTKGIFNDEHKEKASKEAIIANIFIQNIGQKEGFILQRFISSNATGTRIIEMSFLPPMKKID